MDDKTFSNILLSVYNLSDDSIRCLFTTSDYSIFNSIAGSRKHISTHGLEDATITQWVPEYSGNDPIPKMRPYIVGASGRVWTKYINKCRICNERFRLSEEAILEARLNDSYFNNATEAEVANACEMCLECALGETDLEEKNLETK
jgi:hypothetical protein